MVAPHRIHELKNVPYLPLSPSILPLPPLPLLIYSRVVAPHRIHELKNVPYLHGRCVRWAPTMPMVPTYLS